MSAAKSRFETVRIEELKKILPGQVLDVNENHNHDQQDKRKDKQPMRKPKAKA